jgi:hypothetical protein
VRLLVVKDVPCILQSRPSIATPPFLQKFTRRRWTDRQNAVVLAILDRKQLKNVAISLTDNMIHPKVHSDARSRVRDPYIQGYAI